MHYSDPNMAFNISYFKEIIIALMMQVFLDSFGWSGEPDKWSFDESIL